MYNKRKSTILVLLAAVSASIAASITAIPKVRHIFIVLPLVIMGVLLLFAGYYAGLSHKEK